MKPSQMKQTRRPISSPMATDAPDSKAASAEARSPAAARLAALDGFRASLALWVLFGHVANAVGMGIPIVSNAGLAVDLFMVLSGFLMVHTWKGPPVEAVLLSRGTRDFYVARFFRIAPLFYFLCIVCYFLLPHLVVMSDEAKRMLPSPWITDPAAYHPHAAWVFASVEWVVLHVTFLFGLVPGMESASPLPDWSLSLEMQFYLLLPLLLVVMRKAPMLLLAAVFAGLALASPPLLGRYVEPGTLAHFGQPSVLTYRLNAFFFGMIVAVWLRGQRDCDGLRPRNAHAALAAVVCLLPLNKVVILACALMALLTVRRVPVFTWFFSTRLMRHIGHISYSVYLCHLLILIPLVHVLVMRFQMQQWQPMVRFAVTAGIALPIVLLVSHALYRWIELPGIRWGRTLVRRGREADEARAKEETPVVAG